MMQVTNVSHYWTCNGLMMEDTNVSQSSIKWKGLDDASHQCKSFSYWNWKGLGDASHQCESFSYWAWNGLMMEAANVSHSLSKMERAWWCKSPMWVIRLIKWKRFWCCSSRTYLPSIPHPLSPFTGENSVSPNSLPFACADAGYTINDTI